MTRKSTYLFIAIVAGLVALSLFFKKDQEPTFAESVEEAAAVVESSDPQSEDEIVLATKPLNKTQVTEIPSHGDNTAAQARRLHLPQEKAVANKVTPTSRQLAQSSMLSGTSWKVWEGMTAYPKSAGPRADAVAEVSGFYLVPQEGLRPDERNYSNAQPMIVYNERKNIAGVVTGSVQITLREGAEIDPVLETFDLKVVGQLPEIRTYFVTSAQQPYDLFSLKDRLGSEPGISDVRLEILSRQYEKF
ncbi:hypothetical protein EZJ49_03940 [Bdellovibrio bacteriovorus]|uniref:hypothetical protein n=1 Tax=Bdellovibrio bacteriovorus TaxID=959 RepID=UPI0021CF0A9B|nr:hypothetical protein [Bdellovibrio bacteriovorus]UXR65402.1 hypothetical protein EZJ49_03940 [Bdellovibrio bacteriovorus]